MPDSVRHSFTGKHVLITGASGFLGKVFLAMVLSRLPQIGRIYLLMRPKNGDSAAARFEAIINHSPCFGPLHQEHGAGLSAFISSRVQVLEGDTTRDDLGFDASTAQRLRDRLDLIVNCAGDVEFDPDLRDAIGTNVDGTLRVADFARSCGTDGAALLHVSTCYVVGGRPGFIKEELRADIAPNGAAFDSVVEHADVRAVIAAIEAETDRPEVRAEIAERVEQGARKRGLDPADANVIAMLAPRYEKRWLKERMIAEGRRRATAWGFRNIYTYSKFLAEARLAEAVGDVPFAVVRPAIVESALAFPFPGWNEGVTTCGPLTHLTSGWFRLFPARPGQPFDIVPVDLICNALCAVSAALLRQQAGASVAVAQVFQLSTSTRNCLTMLRASDIVSLAHRRYLRKHGKHFIDRHVLSRWDIMLAEPDHPFRLGNIAKGAQLVERWVARLPDGLPEPVRRGADRVGAMSKNSGYVISQVDRMLRAFEPFIHDDHFEFESRAIDALPAVEEEFRFATDRIDWRHYWMEVHLPGLRRWIWPEIDGREVERFLPEHPFELASLDASFAADAGPDSRAANDNGPSEAAAPRSVARRVAP